MGDRRWGRGAGGWGLGVRGWGIPLLGAWLLLPALATGQVIEGPESAPPNRLVRLAITELTPDDSAVWTAYPFDRADLEAAPDGHSAVLVAPPGTRVDVQAVYLHAGKLGQARHSVTIEGLAPTPTPPPPPDPTPNPQPPTPPPAPEPTPPPAVTGRLHVSYIVDAQQVTPGEAAIRTDPAVRAALASLDAAWHTYQSTEEDLDRLHLRSYLATTGYPALVIQDSAGKVVAAKRVISADEVLDAVRAVRGGRITP